MYTVGPTNNYISQVIPHDSRLISEWFDSCEKCRRFTMVLDDTHIYHAWEDGLMSVGDLYFKNNVEMDPDATLESPEILTTNSGKLAVMENGQPFPVFNDVLYDHLILINPSKGTGANFPEDHSVVAGNMQIASFPSGNYTPGAEGKLRANIAIYPRLKTS
jgi:hypothetical protein